MLRWHGSAPCPSQKCPAQLLSASPWGHMGVNDAGVPRTVSRDDTERVPCCGASPAAAAPRWCPRPASPLLPSCATAIASPWFLPKVGLAPPPLPAVTLARLCPSHSTFDQCQGLKCGAQTCGMAGPAPSCQLMAEVGRDEGLYSHVTLRSKVQGVRTQRGPCSSPQAALGTCRERMCCPLPPPHGTFHRAEQTGRSKAGGKQPASSAEESTGCTKGALFPP